MTLSELKKEYEAIQREYPRLLAQATLCIQRLEAWLNLPPGPTHQELDGFGHRVESYVRALQEWAATELAPGNPHL